MINIYFPTLFAMQSFLFATILRVMLLLSHIKIFRRHSNDYYSPYKLMLSAFFVHTRHNIHDITLAH